MKVLLTGAAGMVGHHMIPQLLDKKHELTILELDTKQNRKKLKKYQSQINIIWGDICNEDDVKKALHNQDVVIHLAGVIPPLSEKNHHLTRQTNYEGTKNIVFSIQENKKGFLIFASSISVYGDRLENYRIKVTDPLIEDDKDYYAFIKKQTEKLIIESGIDYTIFRPTAIMDIPKLDKLMYKMPLETKLEIITAKDAARAFVNSLDHLKKIKGKTFNLGGGILCRTTYEKFLKNCCDIYGIKTKHLNFNKFAKSGFHCGYYEDANKLNKIINFRRDTLETYYQYLYNNTTVVKKLLTGLFSYFIIKSMK